MKKSYLAFLVVAACFTAVAAQPAFAQLSAEELRAERIESIEALKGTQDVSGGSSKFFGDLGRRTGWFFNYGGAFSTTYTGGDNGTDRDNGAADATDHNYDYEFKPFLNVTSKDRKTKFYTRVSTKYTETKKNSASTRGNNFIQPVVEMAYWEKEFAGSEKSPGVKKKLTLGRQFIQVGRGIAYAMTVDGFLYDVTGLAKKKGEYKFFFARQNPGDDNVDASVSGSGRVKRMFYGIRGKYTVHPKAKMSFYTVQTIDKNKEVNPTIANQRHKFEPNYYGAVSEGRITKDLQYWGEYIVQRGKTYDSSTTTVSKEVNMKASAMVAGLKYYFSGDLKPTVSAEYITGSGDPDAITSTNSSQGGSAPGTDDSRFNPLGGVSMGFALSPTMTNMKVYKFGGSIKPFGRSPSRMYNEMTIIPEYYIYQRRTGNLGAAGADGVLSTATRTSDKIGDEVNLTVSWRLMSDMTYQLKYGHFSPGSAYTKTSSETYMRFKISIEM